MIHKNVVTFIFRCTMQYTLEPQENLVDGNKSTSQFEEKLTSVVTD